MRYIARAPRYRSLDVAKALARMAYFVLPEADLARFEHIRRWLRGEVAWLPVLFRGSVRGQGFVRPL